jgi:hypothetical protein
MTIKETYRIDDETTHSNTTWETILTRVVALSGINIMWIGAEYGGEVTNRDVGMRVMIDNVEVWQDYHQPSRANGFKLFAPPALIIDAPSTEQVYTIRLQGIIESSPQVLHVRRKNLMILQE